MDTFLRELAREFHALSARRTRNVCLVTPCVWLRHSEGSLIDLEWRLPERMPWQGICVVKVLLTLGLIIRVFFLLQTYGVD